MKRVNKIFLLSFGLLFMAGCDKGFEEMNKNPLSINAISDPGLLLSNILRNTSVAGDWLSESTVAQQFILPYNLGATAGLQYNINLDQYNAPPWNVYNGTIRTAVQLMQLTKDDPTRTNLYNQARIWRAFHYMYIVDHYGDVPYFESVRAQSDAIYYPKYDKASAIYDDLYKEIKEATAALDPTKDNTSRFDIFVTSGITTAAQITYWKRLGYSIMLRLGMRYTKVDPTKARAIVQEAFTGGVMQTNADNAVIANMTGTGAGAVINGYNNGRMGGIRGTNPFNYYLTEPLINQLKSTNDPRSKFISANYSNKNTGPNTLNPDVTIANQFGFPVGYDNVTLPTRGPGNFRAAVSSGQNYSQINYNVTGNTTTPSLVITNAQTKLLLAEAAFRGWLTGLPGALTAQQYYDQGIDASMDGYQVFPNVAATGVAATSTAAEIYAWPTTAEKTAYKAQLAVLYNPANALQQINTQYWIECFNNGHEAWSNWRRSGFPALSPNLINNNLNGAFVRRFAYPLTELNNNGANYQAGVAALGGPDNLTTRIFWDIP